MSRPPRALPCATTLLAAVWFASSAAAQRYQPLDLDGNRLLSLGAAFRLAESGIAAGLGNPAAGGNTRAVTWTNRQSTILPPATGHESSFANDVGETGIAVGASEDVSRLGRLIVVRRYAAMWTAGSPVLLSSLVTGGAPLELHEAKRIDERGRILGWGRDASIPALHGFLLENGIVTNLGTLSPTGNVEPFDMNEIGEVVGCAEATNRFDHAFVWRNGVMTDLHDPNVILGQNSTARAINEAGVIVGSADFIPGGIQLETAAMWDHGVITSLGVLAGQQSYARDINDHGTIVGTSTVAAGGVHAFIYRDGVMTDLNTLIPAKSGWTLANAHDISNDGKIVGEGFKSGLRPFLLVPTCGGRFQVYGTGCAGSGGFQPALWGEGCPTSRGNVSFAITGGLGGSVGVLVFGGGMGQAPLGPGCDLQNLPLFPGLVPLQLGGTGPGAGTWQLGTRLGGGFLPVSLFLQGVLVDSGALTVTNPLQMDIR